MLKAYFDRFLALTMVLTVFKYRQTKSGKPYAGGNSGNWHVWYRPTKLAACSPWRCSEMLEICQEGNKIDEQELRMSQAEMPTMPTMAYKGWWGLEQDITRNLFFHWNILQNAWLNRTCSGATCDQEMEDAARKKPAAKVGDQNRPNRFPFHTQPLRETCDCCGGLFWNLNLAGEQ